MSAFLFRESVPGRVIALAEQNAYTLHLSPILLEEVTRALHHPRLKKSYGYSDEEVQAWCHTLKRIGRVWKKALPDVGPVCRDPDDEHVISFGIQAVSAHLKFLGLVLISFGNPHWRPHTFFYHFTSSQINYKSLKKRPRVCRRSMPN